MEREGKLSPGKPKARPNLVPELIVISSALRLRIASTVDLAHAAFADLGDDRVLSDLCDGGNSFVHCVIVSLSVLCFGGLKEFPGESSQSAICVTQLVAPTALGSSLDQ